MNNEIKTRAHFADDFNTIIRINFWKINGDQREVMRGDSWDSIPLHIYSAESHYGVHLDKTEAQALMDDLWDCGLRPSEGQGSAGQLAAVQKHLQDMRIIAWKLLGLEKP